MIENLLIPAEPSPEPRSPTAGVHDDLSDRLPAELADVNVSCELDVEMMTKDYSFVMCNSFGLE
jgi:hypothetical protein